MCTYSKKSCQSNGLKMYIHCLYSRTTQNQNGSFDSLNEFKSKYDNDLLTPLTANWFKWEGKKYMKINTNKNC